MPTGASPNAYAPLFDYLRLYRHTILLIYSYLFSLLRQSRLLPPFFFSPMLIRRLMPCRFRRRYAAATNMPFADAFDISIRLRLFRLTYAAAMPLRYMASLFAPPRYYDIYFTPLTLMACCCCRRYFASLML